MNIAAVAADAVLEGLGVPAYTTPGFRARRALFGWEDPAPGSLRGANIVITGASSGIGREAAVQLARLGARVRSVSRDPGRAGDATEAIRSRSDGGDVEVGVADLTRPAEARDFARRMADELGRIDRLVHDAGSFYEEHTVTPEGVEANAAVYLLAPWILTDTLGGALRAAGSARVITVASSGLYTVGLDADKIEADADGYRPLAAYARVKRAQMALTHQWAQRLAADGVVAHAIQPGWCVTPLLETGLPRFRTALGPILRSPEQGADTLVWTCVADEVGRTTGRLWRDRRRRLEHRFPWTRSPDEDERRVWDWCAATAAAHLS